MKCKYIGLSDGWPITADDDSDKWQTRPLVREGALQRQDSNCETVTNIWSWAPNGARHQNRLTDWLTDYQLKCDFDFDLRLKI
jgi:hypothetical protein